MEFIDFYVGKRIPSVAAAPPAGRAHRSSAHLRRVADPPAPGPLHRPSPPTRPRWPPTRPSPRSGWSGRTAPGRPPASRSVRPRATSTPGPCPAPSPRPATCSPTASSGRRPPPSPTTSPGARRATSTTRRPSGTRRSTAAPTTIWTSRDPGGRVDPLGPARRGRFAQLRDPAVHHRDGARRAGERRPVAALDRGRHRPRGHPDRGAARRKEEYIQSGWLRASPPGPRRRPSPPTWRPFHTDAEADAAPLPAGEFVPVRVEPVPVRPRDPARVEAAPQHRGARRQPAVLDLRHHHPERHPDQRDRPLGRHAVEGAAPGAAVEPDPGGAVDRAGVPGAAQPAVPRLPAGPGGDRCGRDRRRPRRGRVLAGPRAAAANRTATGSSPRAVHADRSADDDPGGRRPTSRSRGR